MATPKPIHTFWPSVDLPRPVLNERNFEIKQGDRIHIEQQKDGSLHLLWLDRPPFAGQMVCLSPPSDSGLCKVDSVIVEQGPSVGVASAHALDSFLQAAECLKEHPMPPISEMPYPAG